MSATPIILKKEYYFITVVKGQNLQEVENG